MIDLLVVGAGPSGLTTAIEAALRGMEVVVADPRPSPIDKACGEGLMPSAIEALDRLGVVIPRSHPFVGIRYVSDGRAADGRFPHGEGLGVRRTVLSQALTDRADAVGVRRVAMRIGTVSQTADHVEAGGLRARHLVAADGLNSPIRRQLGLDRPGRARSRYGLRRHFAVAPWSPFVEVHWAADAEAYVTPVAPDLVGVAFLYGDAARVADAGQPGRPFDRLLARFPSLADRLHDPATAARGSGPFETHAAGRVAGRVMLVGDSAGYLDPITGEGIKLGIAAGRAAVDAIESGSLAGYDRQWARITRRYWWMTSGLLALSERPWARRRMVPVLQRAPWLFHRILGALAHH